MATIFEKIINREIPAYIVYEDDLVISFLDISQVTQGHTLVVPKEPYKDIYEMPENILGHTMKIVSKVSKACKEVFEIEGLNILSNNGAYAGQTVYHFHFHVLPRFIDDGVSMKFPNHMNDMTIAEYKKRALMIKEALL
ncbi:MAG: HIT family protein [Acholeplasmataceae bacterium]|nr:HIT family protein [Acholeplasmataceae bacterium]